MHKKLRFRSLFRRKQMEQELDEELRDHIERQTEENVACGMSAIEACRQAVLAFDGIERSKEECRDRWLGRNIHNLLQDWRLAFRIARKSPAFTLIVVVTLALGIGANTLIFSVVHAVLLRPLPFHEPDRLMVAWENDLKHGQQQLDVSRPDYDDWLAQNHVFSEMAIYTNATVSLTGVPDPERLEEHEISASFFPLMGITPIAGRTFTPAEDTAGGAPVALISEQLWRRRFGADPGAVGRALILGGKPYTLVGIIPASFELPLFVERPDVWVPLRQDTNLHREEREVRWNRVIARLRPDVTLAQAQTELDAIAGRLAVQYPATNADHGVKLVPLQEQLASGTRFNLIVLSGAVGFLLLIACLNLATLFLARGISRNRELGVRTALGASRRRLISQLINESVVYALLGGCAGILLAGLGQKAVVALSPASVPQVQHVQIDLPVLLFTLVLSVATGVLFGLLPSIQASKTALVSSIRQGEKGSTVGRSQKLMQEFLVIAEVALALVLLTGAGLLWHSLSKLLSVEPGLAVDNVLTIPLDLPGVNYPRGEQQQRFFRDVLEKTRQVPGVISAGLVFPLPLSNDPVAFPFTIDGAPSGRRMGAYYRDVSVGYFETMRVPLRGGRTFSELDDRTSPPVAIINQTMAQRFWPDQSPIGKRITIIDSNHQNRATSREIVGIVGDVKHNGLDARSGPEMYTPFLQAPSPWMSLVVRSKVDPGSLSRAIAGRVHEVDAMVPVPEGRTMQEWLSRSVAPRRFNSVLLGLFAMLALALTAVGIWGIVFYSVTQRTREMGIRMALGAQRGVVLRMVLGQGFKLAIIGGLLGLPLAFALSRSLRSMLFGVGSTDPLTFILAPVLLLVTALMASSVPAWRASAVDPMMALRHE